MTDDATICAIATPRGNGAISIIRLSGKDAYTITGKLIQFPSGEKKLVELPANTIHYASIVTGEQIVDEVLVTVMRAPRTYTREDVVEINCHGGAVPLLRTVRLLIEGGARQAEPGEFTRRAFLNGRIDLVQAEAVMDIIHARTERAHQAANEQLTGGLSQEISALREQLIGIIAGVEAAVDFPEEDIETPGSCCERIRWSESLDASLPCPGPGGTDSRKAE